MKSMEQYDKEINRLTQEKETYKSIDLLHEVKSDIARLTSQMTIEDLVKLKIAAQTIVSK